MRVADGLDAVPVSRRAHTVVQVRLTHQRLLRHVLTTLADVVVQPKMGRLGLQVTFCGTSECRRRARVSAAGAAATVATDAAVDAPMICVVQHHRPMNFCVRKLSRAHDALAFFVWDASAVHI